MAKTSKGNTRSRRRRTRGKVYLVVAAVLIIAAAVLAVTVFFRVSAIVVEGCEHYTQQEIATASGVKRGDNLMMLDTGEITSELYDKYPYIQEVVVKKTFPGGIAINITEAQAAAVVEYRGTYWLIGTNGRALEQTGRQDKDNYISLIGLDVQAIEAGRALTLSKDGTIGSDDISGLLTALSDNGILKMVYTIDFTAGYNVVAQFRDKYTVHLGRAEDIDYKVRYLIEVIEYLEQKNEDRAGTIDISEDGDAHFIPES